MKKFCDAYPTRFLRKLYIWQQNCIRIIGTNKLKVFKTEKFNKGEYKMKRKKSQTKLSLSKITVCKLDNSEMDEVLGGILICPPHSINLGGVCPSDTSGSSIITP